MAEDKPVIPKSVLTGQTIHFGIAQVRDQKTPSTALAAAAKSGNINVVAAPAYHELSETSEEARKRHKHVLDEFERRAKARGLVVPTNDGQVRARLRQLGEPICLFGEHPADRRDRLRNVLVKLDITELPPLPGNIGGAPEPSQEDLKKEVFYTHGTKALKNARLWIANYSIPRASERLEGHRKRRMEQPNATVTEEIKIRQYHQTIKTATNQSSQYGDDRPLSSCIFSPDSKKFLVGSWSSLIKLWDISTITTERIYKGHTGRITGLDFHPQATISQNPSLLNFASSSSDATVSLWSIESDTPLHILKGHIDRVTGVAFHPSGRYIATSSADTTVRLWDVEKHRELLLQEGHSRAVQTVSMHPDGSLMFSGGDDCAGRLWDLRTGKNIKLLEGHIKPIHASDFSIDGYHLATGSEDNFIRIWDLRKKENNIVIPGHTSLVTSVHYEPNHSRFLASSSVDTTCRLWSTIDGTPLKTMTNHEQKVLDVKISPDGQLIGSAGYDRTWKLWSTNKDASKKEETEDSAVPSAHKTEFDPKTEDSAPVKPEDVSDPVFEMDTHA